MTIPAVLKRAIAAILALAPPLAGGPLAVSAAGPALASSHDSRATIIDCTAWSSDRLDCFAAGTDRAMWHRWWNG
ncbi:MAG: hypothetical protein KJZ85_09180, partial [Rhodobacteraceae bacterium]|nr:hypothetical protein [Paracoccaceae bacterium]